MYNIENNTVIFSYLETNQNFNNILYLCADLILFLNYLHKIILIINLLVLENSFHKHFICLINFFLQIKY